jgi:DNA invertase Pin-like site-specific DNA recombinase
MLISFAYGRVSSRANLETGASRQEQSIEIQDAQFHEYIRHAQIPPESFGQDFGHIFLERHSGFQKKGDIRKRPEGRRLWDALVAARQLNPDALINLIFTKVDRIGRGWLDTMILLRDLREIKVRLHILMLGGQSFDCESSVGQKIVSDLAWIAEMEVNNTRGRILESFNAKRANDELLGDNVRNTPYGWNAVPTGETRVNKGGKPVVIYRLEPNEQEQKWILHMQSLRTAGWGWRAIATELNRLRVPTKRGIVSMKFNGKTIQTCGKWKFGGVEKVLSNKTTTQWLQSFQARELAA